MWIKCFGVKGKGYACETFFCIYTLDTCRLQITVDLTEIAVDLVYTTTPNHIDNLNCLL